MYTVIYYIHLYTYTHRLRHLEVTAFGHVLRRAFGHKIHLPLATDHSSKTLLRTGPVSHRCPTAHRVPALAQPPAQAGSASLPHQGTVLKSGSSYISQGVQSSSGQSQPVCGPTLPQCGPVCGVDGRFSSTLAFSAICQGDLLVARSTKKLVAIFATSSNAVMQ